MEGPEEFAIQVSGMRAYVVVDRFVNGVAAGGLRFAPSVDSRELRRLARTMSLKWALLRVPIGGCKLGIRGDPTAANKAAVLQAFAAAAREVLTDRIITGPDMGTTPADLTHFFRELGQDAYDVASRALRTQGYRPTAPETYRTIMRGLQEVVTGLAVARAAVAAWRRLEGSLEDATVSIQGFGSVGRVVAQEMDRLGARIVCIADAEGALWNPQGLDVEDLAGGVPGLMDRSRIGRGTEELPRERWLDLDVDILVPAAVADAINQDNFSMVRAKMVVEAANIPVPEEVEMHLHRQGVLVLPDFVVNAGLAGTFGVLVTGKWNHSQDVLAEVVSRIVSSTSAVVEESLQQRKLPRKVAEEMARRWLGD